MKTIRLQITEELHGRLKALCHHHGRQAHLLRRGVRLVCEEEEKKLNPTILPNADSILEKMKNAEEFN